MATTSAEAADVRREVDENPLWYHTMELGPGIVTPGWFDLRAIVDRLPWPDLRGKRCLDVGTYDGYLAFEMERRGAAEVVALDVPGHEDWDWPPLLRARGQEKLKELAGPQKGLGFEIAKRALGSDVTREWLSAYDISAERLGTFDVVVCGALMLHLRDPLRALEAIRRVCDGSFLSSEEIRVGLLSGRSTRPVAELDGTSELCQWWVPNAAGHRQMLLAAGFHIEKAPRPFCISPGPSHPPMPHLWRNVRHRAALRLVTGGQGFPYQALLARPAV